MKNFKVFAFATFILFFIGCTKDNQPVEAVRTTFKSMYPGASRIEWKVKSNYYVADFHHDREEKEAWFDQQGLWWLTETDILPSNLPNAIRQAIAQSQYSSWRIDDIDYIEKKDAFPFYVVEVELGEQERDLYYLADGTFLKETAGDDDHHNRPSPEMSNQEIKMAVERKYPNARIIDVDIEWNHIEIDLVHENVYWEMILDKQYNWLKSTQDFLWSGVPEVVKNALASKGHSFDVREDEVEKEMHPGTVEDITVYHIELDRELGDIHFYFKEDGSDWES